MNRSRILLTLACILGLAVAASRAQEPRKLRLHVQPGMESMKGDGDETTTITITARDEEGELLNHSGTVKIEASAGFLHEMTVPMQHGVASVQFTAPILDNEDKSFQRSIELTIAVMDRLMSMSPQEITAKDGKMRMTKEMLDVAKNAPTAASMTSITGKDPVVYLVATLGDVKGRASIRIEPVEVRAASTLAGYYEGKDALGQANFQMTLQGSSSGFDGEIRCDGESTVMTIKSKGETKGGFMVVYLFDKREMHTITKSNPDFMGIPSAMKVLPGNTLYIVAPPIYLRRKGDAPPSHEPDGGKEEEPVLPAEQANLIVKRNMLVADGKQTTEVLFSLRNDKGKPIAGAPISSRLTRGGGKLLETPTKTDARGQAKFVYQVPERKTDKLEKLGLCKQDYLTVTYTLPDKSTGSTYAPIGALICADAEILVSKPGFHEDCRIPLIVGSPNGEIKGKLFSKVRRFKAFSFSKIPVNDAEIRIICPALKRIEDTLKTKSDDTGQFVIDLHLRNAGSYWKFAFPDPIEFPISALNDRRRHSLAHELFRFKDEAFTQLAADTMLAMDLGLCKEKRDMAEAIDHKYQLIGDMMETLLMTDKLMEDTGKEVISQAWDLMVATAKVANEEFKITDRIFKTSNKNLEKLLGLTDSDPGNVKMRIYKKLRSIFGDFPFPDGQTSTIVLVESVNNKVFRQLLSFLQTLSAKLEVVANAPNPISHSLEMAAHEHFMRQVKPHLAQFLKNHPKDVADHFGSLQYFAVDAAGKLRAHYLNIASWRMSSEYLKAAKDLVVDLTLAVAVATAAIGNFKALELYQKINKYSERLDVLWSGCGVAAEIYNLVQLSAECAEIFARVARDTRGSGAVSTTRGFHLMPTARAQEGENSIGPPSLSPTLQGLQSKDPTVRARSLVAAVALRRQWDQWRWEQDTTMAWSLGDDVERNRNIETADQTLDDNLIRLMAITADGGIAEHDQWDTVTAEIQTSAKTLDQEVREAWLDGKENQANAINTPIKGSRTFGPGQSWDVRWIVLIIAAGTGLLMIVLALVWMRKNRKQQETKPTQLMLASPLGQHALFDGMTLGAAADNTITLPYAGVAPYHARLRQSPEGAWWVESLDANQPVLIAGQPSPSAWLAPQMTLTLGSASIIVMQAQD